MEAYKVGVTVALTNKVSQGLLLIQRDLKKTDAQAVALHATLNRISKLAIGGALLGGAGYAGLHAISKAVEPAKEYVHQLELARAAMANLKPAEAQLQMAQMTAAAWQTTGKVMTTTATDNLKALRELRMVFGDTQDAVQFLPQMQRLEGVLHSVLHGVGGVGAKDVAFTTAKMLELRGASMNPQTFQEQADLLTKAVIASGGKVTPQMAFMAQKYSGVGGMSYSNAFMYGMLPTLVQELGGSSTGNSLTSMYRAIVGGRIDKRSMAVWQRLGLADTSHADVGKDTALIPKGGMRGSDLFKTSPYRYVQEVLLPALISHGIVKKADQLQAIDQLFSNRVAARIAGILGVQGPRLEKDFNLIGQAGTTAYFDECSVDILVGAGV